MSQFEALVRDALAISHEVDLSGCPYGPAHWDGPVSTEPLPYYRLLAGLVRARGCRRVLELGTHAGGATLAMTRALPQAPDSRLVTVDVTAIPNPLLDADPRVTRVNGDLFAPATMARVSELLGSEPVDLLFIDIVHGYHQTRRALGLYANRFQPTLIAMDDTALGAGMRAAWSELARAHPGIECGTILGRPEIGFGLAFPVRPYRLEEGQGWRVGMWSLRRAISARLPYRLKTQIGRILDRLSPGVHRHLDPS